MVAGSFVESLALRFGILNVQTQTTVIFNTRAILAAILLIGILATLIYIKFCAKRDSVGEKIFKTFLQSPAVLAKNRRLGVNRVHRD